MAHRAVPLTKKEIDAYYGSCCTYKHNTIIAGTGPVTDAMRKEAARIAKGIFNGTLTDGEIDPALTELVATELKKALLQGFTSTTPEPDFTTPDNVMLQALQNNTVKFSAAKTAQMQHSFTLALRDDKGQLRPFEGYRTEVLKITDEYVGNWLRAEYNLAVAVGQMAAKWVRIQQDKELFPYLQYITAGDERVRPAHQQLDLITLPVDHPFWDTFFPPNGWNCRCDVLQLESAEPYTGTLPAADELPPAFRTNLAKRGLVFPPDHPYWRGVNNYAIDEVIKKIDGASN